MPDSMQAGAAVAAVATLLAVLATGATQPTPEPAAQPPDDSVVADAAPGDVVGVGGPPAGVLSTWIWSPGPVAARDDPQRDAAVAHAVAWLEARGLAHHVYARLGMVAFVGDGAAAQALLALGGRIDPNERMDLHLDRSVPYIEADRVAAAVGVVRDGPTVVVVDTGIDSLHPDFDSRRNLAANVQAERQGGLVTGVLAQQPVVDVSGHGTHVSGIVAGLAEALGRADANHQRYKGVYAVGRVAGFQASTEGTDDIKVDTIAALEAFEWTLDHQGDFDVRVVTNSWGTMGVFDADHPVQQATLQLYLAGIVVVFSAGNEGDQGSGTLNRYCMAPWVLCVAAGDLGGARASFSSYGRPADAARPWDHPDLTAPGHQIHSAEPPTGTTALDLLQGATSGRVSNAMYGDRSGTSMAAPHVAAVAALVQAANDGLSPDQVMDILVDQTRPMADSVEKVGTGYLDARRSYNLAVQTVGNREAFLSGQEVKYAGRLSGDDLFADDPVSQGYSGTKVAGPTLAPSGDAAWVLSPWGAIVAGVLAFGALVNVAAAVRWRR